jgi:GTP-binding protein HflX
LTWDTSEQTTPTVGRCLVLHPALKGNPHRRDEDARLEEAVRLAEAIDLDIVHAEITPVSRPRPSTLLGQGAIEQLQGIVAARDVEVTVIDFALTPVQQRNLERAWKCKVLDRTALILEIFGARARTKEGTLQVELAALSYQRSRLVRSWTHLERQRGGVGFMGGPGETQIEADRRMISKRITRLKKELVQVHRTRALHRQARQKVPYPVIALVGYTNAGKSTLFNALTNASVLQKDQLFATLDPTMRELTLPCGRQTILSDTVGFVSDLPHELVEAFQATLEEVTEAQILLHVRDIAHEDTEAQKEDVMTVLAGLGLSGDDSPPMIEVRNKADLLDFEELAFQKTQADRSNQAIVLTSARDRAGFDALLKALSDRLGAERRQLSLKIPWSDGKSLAWLYDRGDVRERKDREECVELTVLLDPEDADRIEKRLAN